MTDNLSEFIFAEREEGFDTHIANSIQNFEMLSETVVNASQWFVENNTNVYDLGCSTGRLIDSLYNKNKDTSPDVQYIGIDSEASFTKHYTNKSDKIHLRHGNIISHNYENASFISSIFTLQFISIKERQVLLRRIYDSLNMGSGFILAEKTMSETAKLQDIINSLYYEFKAKSFDAHDILTKERVLRYMMKPITDTQLVAMLEEAGFGTYQKFWQSYNFVGYLAIK